MTAFLIFFALGLGTLAACVGFLGYLWTVTHPDEFSFDAERETLRTALREPFTGGSR